MACWYCRSGGADDKQCWVCGGQESETTAEREKVPSGRSSISQVEKPLGDFDFALERPPPTYLAPYTKSSATQSEDNIENQKPVRPKSFTGTSNRSTHDDPPPIVAPRYPSDVCDFDFTDEGGPIISFIRSSGQSNYPRSMDDSPRFGSIEIVRTKEWYVPRWT